MKVRVERIRRGRRLPDVEYVETWTPRRPPANRHEREGFRGTGEPFPTEHVVTGLRLPWRINHRSE